MNRRIWLALSLLWTGSVVWAGGPPSAALGERLYLQGLREDGSALGGRYSGSTPIEGSAAACVNCHRRSGLGSQEGGVRVPPISGPALFGSDSPVVVRYDRGADLSYSSPHPAYSEDAVIRLMRTGVASDGRVLGPLMPRFDLSDAEAASLVAYLRGLSVTPSRGVSGQVVHLATVVSDEGDPALREALVRMLRSLVAQSNAASAPNGPRHRQPIMERKLGAHPRFELHVWTLTGPKETWGSQLRAAEAAQPVFAVLSGTASDWAPVQGFCEEVAVVCWFPSVRQVPADASASLLSLYFAGGVNTEAKVLASKLKKSEHVLQIVGSGDLAQHGADALAASLSTGAHRAKTVALADSKAALARVERDADVVLWLSPAELAALEVGAGAPRGVYLSSTLGMTTAARLPPRWQSKAFLVREEEEEPLRGENIHRLNAWLASAGIPLIDARLQSEVYLSARFLFSSVHALLRNYQPAALVERAEMMLGDYERMLVNDELQDLQMAPMNKRPKVRETAGESSKLTAQMNRHLEEQRARGGTTVYPRLSLAPGQRIAAKGAYLVRLAPEASHEGAAEWVVP